MVTWDDQAYLSYMTMATLQYYALPVSIHKEACIHSSSGESS